MVSYTYQICMPCIFFLITKHINTTSLSTITFESIFTLHTISRIIYYRYGLGSGFYTGVWFLWALFGIRFILGDNNICGHFRKYYLAIAVLCVFYMTFEKQLIRIDEIFRGYLIGRMVPSLPFFCAGLYIKEQEWSQPFISSKYVPFLLLLAFIIPLMNGYCDINQNKYGLGYIVFVATAILLTFILFYISTYLPVSKFTTTISQGTLAVLGAHTPILTILKKTLPSYLSYAFPIITIILCYLIILLCLRFCPILIGISKRKHHIKT